MAADTAATIVRVRAVVEGLPGLNQLKTAMRGISSESKSASTDLRLVNDQLKGLKNEVNNSINNLRLQVQAFQAVRNSAKIGSDAYREATLRIKELNRELDKAEGRKGGGDRLAGIGAVAGAGFFGGPEALLGSAAGLLAGGVGGAYAGAAIGAQVAMARKAAIDAADYAQQLAKLRLALKGVVDSTEQYNQALSITESISQNLNVPIVEATRGFTRLTAAVVGAGGNVSDAEVVFKGVTSAIKAAGGSAEDVQGGLIAMSQVFSKGKLSAEELSGQLGERLPGAVTLFAQATGRTLPQLQKDLEQGVVGLNDVMRFSDELVKKYAANSESMARSSEDSGARMKVALDKLGLAFGEFFKPVKIGIDNLIASFANMVTRAIQAVQLVRMGIKITDKEQQEIQKTAKQLAAMRYPGNVFKQAYEIPGIEQGLLLDRLRLRGYQANILPTPQGATPESRTTFAEPKPTGGGKDKSESILRKLQADFEKSIAVIGRQFNVKSRALLLSEVLTIENKINMALKKGQDIDVNALRLLQQKKTLEVTRQVLIDEETALENKILDGKVKGVDLTNAQNRLGEIRNEREQTNLALLRLQNDELVQAKSLAQQIADAVPSYEQGIGEMPTVYNIMTGQIKELAATIEDSLPRIMSLADSLSTAFAGAFEGMVFSAQSAQEALGQMFSNIAKSFQSMVMQMITDYLKMQIITLFRNILAPSPISVAGNYYGGPVSDIFTNPSFSFAMGGIMTGNGPLKLRRYAAGGIASGPQLAMFGEGSRPEAYVPLPDGRSIPVSLNGSGAGDVNINVNVDAKGTNVQGSPGRGDQLARAVAMAVQAEMIKQRRPGGILA